jgi:hypothetical protein
MPLPFQPMHFQPPQQAVFRPPNQVHSQPVTLPQHFAPPPSQLPSSAHSGARPLPPLTIPHSYAPLSLPSSRDFIPPTLSSPALLPHQQHSFDDPPLLGEDIPSPPRSRFTFDAPFMDSTPARTHHAPTEQHSEVFLSHLLPHSQPHLAQQSSTQTSSSPLALSARQLSFTRAPNSTSRYGAFLAPPSRTSHRVHMSEPQVDWLGTSPLQASVPAPAPVPMTAALSSPTLLLPHDQKVPSTQHTAAVHPHRRVRVRRKCLPYATSGLPILGLVRNWICAGDDGSHVEEGDQHSSSRVHVHNLYTPTTSCAVELNGSIERFQADLRAAMHVCEGDPFPIGSIPIGGHAHSPAATRATKVSNVTPSPITIHDHPDASVPALTATIRLPESFGLTVPLGLRVLPLADLHESPIFVNARQYPRMLQRHTRHQLAKAALDIVHARAKAIQRISEPSGDLPGDGDIRRMSHHIRAAKRMRSYAGQVPSQAELLRAAIDEEIRARAVDAASAEARAFATPAVHHDARMYQTDSSEEEHEEFEDEEEGEGAMVSMHEEPLPFHYAHSNLHHHLHASK